MAAIHPRILLIQRSKLERDQLAERLRLLSLPELVAWADKRLATAAVDELVDLAVNCIQAEWRKPRGSTGGGRRPKPRVPPDDG